jgi:hypothetical protein
MPRFLAPILDRGGEEPFSHATVARNYPEQLIASNNPIPAAAAATFGHAITATGTQTGQSDPAGGNAASMATRNAYLVTTAAVGAIAGVRTNNRHVLLAGGFRLAARGAQSTGTAAATRRWFMGLVNAIGAPTDVNPSTQVSCIGVGYDDADTNLQVMHNDETGTCTKVNLGAGFPRPAADNTELYRLDLYAPIGGAYVAWRVIRLQTGVAAEGVITTDLPLTSLNYGFRQWASAGATSSVIGIINGGFQLYAVDD